MKSLKTIAAVLVVASIALLWPRQSRASIYGPAPHYENLLVNPNGDTGDLSGWTVTSDGGDGWATTTGYYSENEDDNGFLTSYEWGTREQLVDLLAIGFSAEFLDRQPTIMFSEMFEKVFCADEFFLTIDLLDSNYNLVHSWSSGLLRHINTDCDYSGYKEKVGFELAHYGPGVRYIRWRDGAKDSEWWLGHFGAKLQNAYLAIAPANLLKNPGELSSWMVNANHNFFVTGPPEARQFRTSYTWGQRQQIIDLLALGFTASELDSGKLPIIAEGTYREMACPDHYSLKVELLDANYAVLSTQDSGLKTHDGTCDWTYSQYGETVHHQFIHYPPGVRFVRWQDGGKDTEFWAGHFGSILEAPYLGIVHHRPAAHASSDGIFLNHALSQDLNITYAPDLDSFLEREFARSASYTTVANRKPVQPIPAEPTDSQAKPPCNAECTLAQIYSDLEASDYFNLWNVDQNISVQTFFSPKQGVSRLQKTGEDLMEAVTASIASGTRLIDITSLGHIDYVFDPPHGDAAGDWVKAIGNALRTVEAHAVAHNSWPLVRIHLGLGGLYQNYSDGPLVQGIPDNAWDDHLEAILIRLTRQLRGNSNLTIYISGGRIGGLGPSWNHSKIVAVDGKESFAGGHNLWNVYFNTTPVFDTSIKITGDSALSAHRFVDEVWENHINQFPSHNNHVIKWYQGTRTRNDGLPPFSYEVVGSSPATTSGPIQVLGVGQTASSSPLQQAVLNMIDAANESIYLSQQMLNHFLIDKWYHFDLLMNEVDPAVATRLIQKAIAGVSVKIVLSNPNAGYDTNSKATNEELLEYMWEAARENGVDDTKANREKLCQNLKLAYLRIDGEHESFATYPGISPDNPQRNESFANHSKAIMVDKKVFLVGSHNLYAQDPAQHSEYVYIVGNEAEARRFFDSYWERLDSHSKGTEIDTKICIDIIEPFYWWCWQCYVSR